MENAKKYLIASYVITIFSIGFLSYLSSLNSQNILIFSLVFIGLISVIFFYGINLLKSKKEEIIFSEIEKKDIFLEKEFLEMLAENIIMFIIMFCLLITCELLIF